MKKLSNKKINKTFRDNLITYGMVIAAYVIMQILVSAGSVSSLIQGLLVPLCTYAILAVSLNLTVGILGELSLGHAGFMCIGAFTSAFFSKVMENSSNAFRPSLFLCYSDRCIFCRCVRTADRYPRTSFEG